MKFLRNVFKSKESEMVNYHVLNNSVVINYDGKTESVHQGDSRYQRILQCIREKRLGDIPEIVEENQIDAGGLQTIDGLIHINGEALPYELSNRVMAFKEQELPYEPLIKFWENLRENPSFNSRKMLYKFLEHNGHPITEDGCFIAYRGVTEDFKDRHTKTFDNSVGTTCEMPRTEVDDNPDNTCSAGLHVACYDYAYGFGPKRIEVKVNPKDVVCVPRDYRGTKMRVCKFEVLNVCEGMRDEPLYQIDEGAETVGGAL